ncbi:alpha/beta hydrolase [Legionella spiritensis]|uniref:alpha/beta hydrolase n=1 Tax=Legionella spiritensis TaxID=452 RepID=UPI000F6BCAD6|nr:alpha/beta fold hydrolase [Legionella spiritensis]VEG92033.1 putative hydrolase [Legionella spiritensis]
MIVHSLKEMRDFFYARLCYQIFITPIPFPLEKQYRDFAERACEFVLKNRSELIVRQTPRHHVIHRFAQPHTTNARKVLITHGWMSRAAYMVKLIRALHKQGYDVYALDFPAHGEAKGIQLPWTDAVMILQNVINTLGPFYGVIGHSFGGSMLLNTLNLACQFQEWRLNIEPERVVLIASPTRMRTPVSKLARRFGLSGKAFMELRDLFRQNTFTKIEHLNFRHFAEHGTMPVLCIHGKEDHTIRPIESVLFCQRYPHASLKLIPGIDHVDVLIDTRVEHEVSQFLDR